MIVDDGRPEYCVGVPINSLLNRSGIAFGGERHTTGPSRELVERAPGRYLKGWCAGMWIHYITMRKLLRSHTRSSHTSAMVSPSLEGPTGDALSSTSLVNGESVPMGVTTSVLFSSLASSMTICCTTTMVFVVVVAVALVTVVSGTKAEFGMELGVVDRVLVKWRGMNKQYEV